MSNELGTLTCKKHSWSTTRSLPTHSCRTSMIAKRIDNALHQQMRNTFWEYALAKTLLLGAWSPPTTTPSDVPCVPVNSRCRNVSVKVRRGRKKAEQRNVHPQLSSQWLWHSVMQISTDASSSSGHHTLPHIRVPDSFFFSNMSLYKQILIAEYYATLL